MPTADEIVGTLLIREVRDRAIKATLSLLVGRTRFDDSPHMQAIQCMTADQLDALRWLVRLHTDQVLAELLALLDSDQGLDLLVMTPQGAVRGSEAIDWLAARLHTDDGWIARYSEHEPREGI